MDAAIEVKGLTKHYPGFALQDVSFSLPQGAIMGFIGANGAGKTTTIKALLGLIKTDGGELCLLGGKPTDRKVKRQIGVVLDENNAYDNLSLKQAARVERIMREDWDESLWQSYIERFELPSRQHIKEYSRGMKMKLFIALALAHRPRLLILDEPTSGLDPLMREEMLEVFQEFILDERHAILLSSHITSDLDKIASHIAFIHEGKIIFAQPKASLMEDWGLARCDEAQFKEIPPEFILGYQRNSFGYEMLVCDKPRLAQSLPWLALGSASTEDIMLFYVQGQKGAKQ
jgi:ABC-2 type transport system ATP-binding protein